MSDLIVPTHLVAELGPLRRGTAARVLDGAVPVLATPAAVAAAAAGVTAAGAAGAAGYVAEEAADG